MAIYYDNFESYALGTTAATFGDWNGQAEIVADNYLPAGSKALRTRRNFQNTAFADGGLYSTGTVYVAYKPDETFSNGRIMEFWNGSPAAPSGTTPLLTILQNLDGTLQVNATAYGAVSNSGDFSFKLRKWSWLQVNIIVSNVAGFIGLDFEVACEGVSLCSGSVTTGLLITGLLSGTAQFDYILLDNTVIWDEFTFDTLQSINTYPNPGSPTVRASTGLIEVIETTEASAARISTGLIELIISGENSVYEA